MWITDDFYLFINVCFLTSFVFLHFCWASSKIRANFLCQGLKVNHVVFPKQRYKSKETEATKIMYYIIYLLRLNGQKAVHNVMAGGKFQNFSFLDYWIKYTYL